ncbi:MAG TPA: branched-chain amino acid ABC transporter permease [Candidatus Dormibacteraeota bacterium]|nr:branched-chain amino acid ABC transporter permease [Candidatus Dormibacteraeota bacterium]
MTGPGEGVQGNVWRSWQGLGGRRWIPVLVLAAALPFAIDNQPFDVSSRYLLIVAATCAAFASLALGLNVVVGYAGLLNLGYVAFFGIGAYTYAIVASVQAGRHWPPVLGLLLAGLVVAVVAVLLGLASLRLRGDYLAIVTLGFGEIVRQLMVNLDRPIDITGGLNGILGIDPIAVGGLQALSDRDYYYLLVGFCALFVFVMLRWERSRVGRAWMAIRDDELAARCMGVNVLGFRVMAFTAGAVVAGLTGVIYYSWRASVFPSSFTINDTVTVFMMVILGGMGSIPGVILGAIGITVLEEVLRPYGEYRFVIFGIALVLLMRFRPQGLLGRFSFRPRPRPGPPAEPAEEDVAAAPEATA